MNIVLMIACALGIIQGIMTLVGGCIAAFDRNKDLSSEGSKLYNLQSNDIKDRKYGCGDMKLSNAPSNLWVSDESCEHKYDKMDRGWFRRVHNYCYNIDSANRSYPDACDLKGFGVVLAYAITCGIGWMVSGVIALLASMMNNKLFAFAAAGAFGVFYIIFIVLFALVWNSVRKMNKECLNKACNAVKKRGKKSSFEFLAYSICSFVLIFGAIICCVLGALSMGDDTSDTAGGQSYPTSYPNTGKEENKDAHPVDNPESEAQPIASSPAKGDKVSHEPRTEERPVVSAAGQEYLKKFNELNKYIADKDRMAKYADKKFDETDVDHSGTIVHSEFKAFVSKIMGKKGLPTPSDRKVAALMKKYDTDKSDTLEKNEFHDMLLEIFIESREILISKYAARKADSWKPGKVPTTRDTSKLQELDDLLKDTEKFYKVFEEHARRADTNKNAMLDIDEVTALVKEFCTRYHSPVLSRSDIIEVMTDMGRDIREYDATDLRMVAYAVMSISSNLLK